MSRFSRSFLAVSISAALFAPQIHAEDTVDNNAQELPAIDQCLVNEPEPENPNEQPINVEADNLEAIAGDKATYSGNVVVVQGKKRIEADTLTMHQKENVAVAEGNVKFSDGQVKAEADKAVNDLNTDLMTLENTKYQFLCEPGRGEAAYISKTGKAMYKIEDGSITSCPEDDNSWRLRASSIDVDQDEEQATFYNPRLEIQRVPVFYLPMLTVPIGDTRKTGFLYPSISYGTRDGFEMEIPVYWNLAPNYDLTTTYHYMENRGNQLNSTFRYLTDLGAGSIKSEYMNSDDLYPEYGSRWGFQYEHSGIFQEAWKFDVDYSKVSDIDYFEDLSSDIGNREDGQLIQEGQVSYRSENWDTSVLVRQFQLLLDNPNSSSQPYRMLPQLTYNYYAPEVMRYLDFDLKSHITRFETDAPKKPDATRVHIEPGLKIPLANTWGSWTTEARLLGTYYQQDLKGVTSSDYEESVSRVIPEFRSNAGIVLERDTALIDGYTQSLEPQVQYLYVPKENQDNIARYDTTLLQTDYYGLFRSRKYSGVDYIAPANQFSYGASSRFFDENYKERLNVAFGQIFYLDKNFKDPEQESSDDTKTNYSAWAVETDFNYDDALFYHGGLQYDVDSSALQLANSTLEYQFTGGYIQTNYRYVTKSYIEDTVGDSLNVNRLTEDGISQAGILTKYQLSRKWSTKAQYFYDLTTSQALEWMANLTYTSDCWYMGFTYSKQLKDWDTITTSTDSGSYFSDPYYENNFSINFGIVGFGTNAGSDAGGASNSLGYGRPFFLNN